MCGAQTAVTLQFFTLYKSDYNNFHGLYSNGPSELSTNQCAP